MGSVRINPRIKSAKPTGALEAVNRMHEKEQNRYDSAALNRNIPASTKHVLFDYYHCLICQKEKECKRDYPERPKCPIADFYIDYGLLKEKFPGYDWSELIKE